MSIGEHPHSHCGVVHRFVKQVECIVHEFFLLSLPTLVGNRHAHEESGELEDMLGTRLADFDSLLEDADIVVVDPTHDSCASCIVDVSSVGVPSIS